MCVGEKERERKIESHTHVTEVMSFFHLSTDGQQGPNSRDISHVKVVHL